MSDETDFETCFETNAPGQVQRLDVIESPRGKRHWTPEARAQIIDETFLDLAGFEHLDLVAHSQAMRARVLQWTSIPTCVGIGTTKTLAKVANAAAKKNPLFDSVADLRDENIRNWVLDHFDIRDVWGIGRATASKLNGANINTAGQLRDMPMKHARAMGGVMLERVVGELRGVPSYVIEMLPPQRKGITVSRSFGQPIRDFDTVMSAVAQYATRASEKLRHHQLVAGRLTVFCHTSRYNAQGLPYNGFRVLSLGEMTNDTIEVVKCAGRGLKSIWRDGLAYTKAGIMLEDLISEELRPQTLFEAPDERRVRLMGAMDAINAKYGRMTAHTGVQGFNQTWKARAANKSPAYTTKIAEVPVVHCGFRVRG